MLNQFENVIKNKKITTEELNDAHISDEDMKKIITDTMGRISQTLETKNFMRWMKTKGVAKSLRKLIVRVCNEKNDEYLKNSPLVAGYAEHSKTRITLNEYRQGVEDILNHEFLHIIAGVGKNNYFTFLNEGLTQYITELIKGKQQENVGYRDNVAIVERLHRIIGDKFIKSYLIGQPILGKEILPLLGEEKINLLLKDLREFHDNNTIKDIINNKLNDEKFNAKTYGERYAEYDEMSKEQLQEESKKIDDRKNRIIENMHELAIAKLEDRIKNLEFYKDGKLDLNSIGQEIYNLIFFEYKMLSDLKMPMDISCANDICNRISNSILENSHILIDRTDEAKERIRRDFKYNFSIAEDGQWILSKSFTINELNQITPEQSFEKLMKLLLEGKKDLDIIQYTDILTKVQKATGVTEKTLLEYKPNFSNYTIEYKEDVEKLYPLYKALNELDNKNKEDTIDSMFYELPSTQEGIKTYIERRDRNFYYVELDEKTGKFEERSLEHGIFDHKECRSIHDCVMDTKILNSQKEKLKEGDAIPEYTDTFCITTGRNNEETYITFVEDEPQIAFRDSKGNTKKVLGKRLEDIKKDCAIEKVFERIKKGNYKENNQENKFDHEQLVRDIKIIRNELPKKGFNELAYNASYNIIKSIYCANISSSEVSNKIDSVANQIVKNSMPNQTEQSEEINNNYLKNRIKLLEESIVNYKKEITEQAKRLGIPIMGVNWFRNSAIEAAKESVIASDITEQKNAIVQVEKKTNDIVEPQKTKMEKE